MRPRLILTLLFLLPVVCVAQGQKVSNDQYQDRSLRIPIEGAKIFQSQCATCHGADGRGPGPASPALKHAVLNLTLISERNGGKFPAQRVKEFIEGKGSGPSGRSEREMPVWGPIFHQVEVDQDWGEVRLDAITRQVESIQQK